jgi:FtsZ-binding cell division protein ZapB
MDKNSSDNMESLAELLPEGLTEHSVDEIAKLVDSVITERVESEVDGLITKVNAFLRMKVDEIKDYALKELEQDEEFVHNGQVYESLKSLMAMELRSTDEESAISGLVDVNEEANENVSILTKEVEKLMEENSKLQTVSQVLHSKIKLLEQEKSELKKEAETLVESQQLPFESSEKAVMVSNSESGSDTADDEEIQSINEFLTPEVMRFMPMTE